MKHYIFPILILFAISCSNSEADEEKVKEDILLIEKYLTISEAIYKGSSVGTSFKIKSALSSFNQDSLKSESTIEALSILERMTKTKDLTVIRKHFKDLSAIAIEKAKTSGRTFYVQHCPMAFDNTGANWLSNSEDINNPYFGPNMPHCGSVVETIAAK